MIWFLTRLAVQSDNTLHALASLLGGAKKRKKKTYTKPKKNKHKRRKVRLSLSRTPGCTAPLTPATLLANRSSLLSWRFTRWMIAAR